MFQDGSVRQILSESRTLRWATTAASHHACQAKLCFTSHTSNHGRWAPQLRRVSVVTIAVCLSPGHSNRARSYNRQKRRTPYHPTFSKPGQLRPKLILTYPTAQILDTPAARTDSGYPKASHRQPQQLARHESMLPNITSPKRFSFNDFRHCFNSLFKVLFIFPSRYLFAIGLSQIFSFRCTLPPTSRFNPKKHYSSNIRRNAADSVQQTGFSPSPTPCSKGLMHRPHANACL